MDGQRSWDFKRRIIGEREEMQREKAKTKGHLKDHMETVVKIYSHTRAC